METGTVLNPPFFLQSRGQVENVPLPTNLCVWKMLFRNKRKYNGCAWVYIFELALYALYKYIGNSLPLFFTFF